MHIAMRMIDRFRCRLLLLLLCGLLTACVAPSDQQALMMEGLRSWHFLPDETLSGRENFVLDNRAGVLITVVAADPWLLEHRRHDAQTINQHFAMQVYAHVRTWFPGTIFIDQSMDLTVALQAAQQRGLDYVMQPRMEGWVDRSAPLLGHFWPGAGGVDSAAAVISLYDARTGHLIGNWEIHGDSGLLTMMGDAPSHLVGQGLEEFSRRLSGHSRQGRRGLDWF